MHSLQDLNFCIDYFCEVPWLDARDHFFATYLTGRCSTGARVTNYECQEDVKIWCITKRKGVVLCPVGII